MKNTLFALLLLFYGLSNSGNVFAQMTETEKVLLLGQVEISLEEYCGRLNFLQSRLNDLSVLSKNDTARIRSELKTLIAYLPHQSKIRIPREDQEDGTIQEYRVTVQHGWFIDNLESLVYSDTAKLVHLLLISEQLAHAVQTAGIMIEMGVPPVPKSYKHIIKEIKSREEFQPIKKEEGRNLLYDFFKWLAEQLEKLLGKILPKSIPEVGAAPAVPQTALGISHILLYIFYVIGGIMLLYILYRLVRLYKNRKRAETQNADELISSLLEPGEPAEPDYHLERAEYYASREEFRRALRHLVLSVLLFLDKKDIIRMIFFRTNKEYLDAIQENNDLPGRDHLTVGLSFLFFWFDRVWYGNKPIDREKYDLCFQSSEKIRKLYVSQYM